MRELLHRLFSRASERDLREDLDLHLDLAAEDYIRRGHSREEARRRARIDLGGVEQTIESWRDQRGLPWLETFWSDLRFALRTLRRTPGFTTGVLVTLALGIGANTAIFSVVRGALLTPPPYPAYDRLGIVHRLSPQGGLGISQSGERFFYLRDNTRSFSSMALQGGSAGVNLSGFGALEYVRAVPVTARFFDTLGIRPRYGRAFTSEEDRPNGPAAVILDYSFWRRRFQQNPAILGQTIKLSGAPHTVVGIMGPDFQPIPATDVFLPLAPNPRADGNNYTLLARRKPGVTAAQASADLNLAMDAFRRLKHGDDDERVSLALIPYAEVMTREARLPLLILFSAVAVLLLLACTNLAGLMLARASTRQREMAVRAAMGAGARRLVRQLLTESSLLSVAGGLLGLLLASALLPALLSATPEDWRPVEKLRLDWAVLAFTLGASLLSGLLFGVLPAFQATRHDLAGSLHDGGARASASRFSARSRQALVGVQVALCTLLMIGAGLLLRTFHNLTSVELGFNPENVVTAHMAINGAETRDAASVASLYERVLSELRAIPGVEAAAAASTLPLERALNLPVKALDGSIAACDYRYVTPAYLQVLRIPLRAGRFFTPSDTPASAPVAIVNEAYVRRYLPGTAGVGQRVDFSAMPKLPHTYIPIVGVIADVRESGVDRPTPPTVFVPVGQVPDRILQTLHSWLQMSWLVRSRKTSADLEQAIRRTIASADPEQAIADVRPMTAIYADSFSRTRFQTLLLGGFALLALALAAAGIAALVSYTLAQRERELGIRLALGADTGALLASLLHAGFLCVLAGLAAGIAASSVLTRWLRQFLYGVEPLDPLSFAIACASLILIALAAMFVPARRVLSLDPGKVLRAD